MNVPPTILPQEGKKRKTIVKTPSSGHRDSVWGVSGEVFQTKKHVCLENIGKYTLQETNISPKFGILKMIFLFPRWDMLIPWRVCFLIDNGQAGVRGFKLMVK